MPIIPIIRSGGPKPSGKIEITNNGTGIDVAQYAEADVAVPASAVVSGTKSITANGTDIDVTNYAKVDVAVPSSSTTMGSITVSGTSGYHLTVDNACEIVDGVLKTYKVAVSGTTSATISIPVAEATSTPYILQLTGTDGRIGNITGGIAGSVNPATTPSFTKTVGVINGATVLVSMQDD